MPDEAEQSYINNSKDTENENPDISYGLLSSHLYRLNWSNTEISVEFHWSTLNKLVSITFQSYGLGHELQNLVKRHFKYCDR